MLSSLVQKMSQSLFDLLLPPKCVHCKAAGSWFCQSCLERIPFITGTICHHCGTPLPDGATRFCRQCRDYALNAIDGIRSAAPFVDNPLRSAIHDFKYNNHRALTPALGEILVASYRRHQLEVEVIVPVPLHELKLKERGYNQSELLARQLGQALNLPVNVTTLRRARKTESQMTLKADERLKNVANAFSCADRNLDRRHVLLVDDVCTTGSTLDACAVALKAGGAASVWGLTLAKAL